MSNEVMSDEIARAAEIISEADSLFITAGAGMGVDSGLPDFRGDDGFWNAYPVYKSSNQSFRDMASADVFLTDPVVAWGFYGHRLNLYRKVVPHEGFRILNEWANRARGGSFVFTSNVDGQFQKTGFSSSHIEECHGSIHYLQCMRGCGQVSSADGCDVVVNEQLRAEGILPSCKDCGGLLRPNILMFDDLWWNDIRHAEQREARLDWLSGGRGKLAIVECGAGCSIPTVRRASESLLKNDNVQLIRINPNDYSVPKEGAIGINMGALDGLKAIDALLTG